ncbi:HNH endonuclease [Pseudomonas sp. JS3066]|uniref:HNH endonuclease n=1 Tax=Pseudomonas sp. JS3066 TaxID=3090665 RepID=UPI002E7C2D25|nr:HNH endonuclease [Pseudomonas sp. JS3066]WVK91129.1 HNH endonuclease [Pseudomonas sp. JS3066]
MSARKSLATPRAQAFKAQRGRCYYCHLPMWQSNPEQFATRHGLTVGQVQALRCTGEHLVAHKDGGGAERCNIVAACRFCNQARHRRPIDLSAEQFASHVRQRLAKGAWHPRELRRLSDR